MESKFKQNCLPFWDQAWHLAQDLHSAVLYPLPQP